MRISLITFLYVVLLAYAAEATPAQVMPAKDAAHVDFSDEPYVIEKLNNSLQFEADGRGQHELTLRMRGTVGIRGARIRAAGISVHGELRVNRRN